ncbi:hypothetical protein [Leptospira santarosai]|uniref:hypothetical protein n=1 Tax=Leptospira santarosai TaxID=28183 RepID=UPI0002FEB896|nr:hypothetical protein [Leptospira santarosai]
MEFSVGTDGSEVRARNLQTCRSLVRESGPIASTGIKPYDLKTPNIIIQEYG